MPEHFLWSNVFKKKSAQKKALSEILKDIPIFSDLNAKSLQKVESICYERYYKEDEVVFRENEAGTCMFILKSGGVRILKKESGKDVQIAVISPGDFFGDLALLVDFPRAATAVASAPSEIIGMDRYALFDLIRRDPWTGNAILLKLAQLTGLRLIEADEKLKKIAP